MENPESWDLLASTIANTDVTNPDNTWNYGFGS